MAQQAIPLFDVNQNPASGARPSANRVVLLASGDGATRKSASRWLASAGFEVVTAEDAAHAVALFA